MGGSADEACGVGSVLMEEQPASTLGVTEIRVDVFAGATVGVVAGFEEQDVRRRKMESKKKKSIFERMNIPCFSTSLRAMAGMQAIEIGRSNL